MTAPEEQFPGVPEYLKIYRVLSPLVMVFIFEQGPKPHPGPNDRMLLYVRIGERFEKMGTKINIPTPFDLEKWVGACLRKRLATRQVAEKRALKEHLQAQQDILHIRKAQGTFSF